MKPVRLSTHALGYISKRGFTVAEVEEAIKSTTWTSAELGRLECRKEFSFGRSWNGTVYSTKQVRPIFVEEDEGIIVVTVYTYYF